MYIYMSYIYIYMSYVYIYINTCIHIYMYTYGITSQRVIFQPFADSISFNVPRVITFHYLGLSGNAEKKPKLPSRNEKG